MVHSECVGFIAGFFNTVTFIPQVYKTWKTKSASDVSIQMFIIATTSASLWSVYGIMINKPSVYTANTVVFLLSTAQIILKLKYDRANKK